MYTQTVSERERERAREGKEDEIDDIQTANDMINTSFEYPVKEKKNESEQSH